ncbi:MAG: DNA polymerase III subunit alpha, partial [Clostridia bacterium]|nr:DNA polymerase III subunit alpha [Clostridia bacterium]
KKACDYVYENHGVKLDFYGMEYDDEEVYNLIASGRTDAVFQLESAGMKKFMKDLKPNCLEDIIAGVSLYRPGPMDSIPKFVRNKLDPSQVVYDDPCLEDILDVTYGCIVYQEQVMKIVQVMAGYSMGQADNIRRIMGKKQVDKIDKEREKFINGWEDPTGKASIPGAVKLGHDKDVANKIFDEMKEFAKYAFNKSHAAAYAHVSYQTAYLKCHYETEFITAVLNNRITNADDIKKYVSFARTEGIDVLPPHINKSTSYFKTENKAIRFGLGGLKHVGIGVTDSIIQERERNGDYKSFDDFITRAVNVGGVNKKAIECLILSGAFDCFGYARSQYMAVYEKLVDRANKDKKTSQIGQISFFGEQQIADTVDYPAIKEFNKKTLLKNEREIIGVYMSGHPLEDHVKKFEGYNLSSEMLAFIEENVEEGGDEEGFDGEHHSESNLYDGQPFVCGGIITEATRKRAKNGKEMCYIKLEDLKGTMEITFFSNAFSKYRDLLEEDNMVTIKGKINIRDGMAPSAVGDAVILWKDEEERAAAQKAKPKERLCLKFDTKNPDIYTKVKSSISSYPGDAQVVIKCSSSGKAFVYQNTVKVNNYLINELSGIIGNENIVVQ